MNNPKPSLKDTALMIIVVTIFAIWVTWAGSHTTISKPLYTVATLNIFLFSWLYFFASFDFNHVQKHTKGWTSSGSAEIEKMGSMDIVYLGLQSVRAKKIVVNLQEIPPKTKFLGRWTVYTSEYQNVTIELWHDHYAFGSRWYYIQY